MNHAAPAVLSKPFPQIRSIAHVDAYRVLLTSLVVVAAALRFWHLDYRPLWLDEISTVHFCALPWADFWKLMWSREANMVAYYVVARLWPLDVRALSAMFSIATIPIVYALGRELFNSRVGLWAAGFLSLNAFHVHYGQEARSYAMFCFLLALAAYLAARGEWGWYAAVCAVAFYTQLFAILFVASHVTILLILRRGPAKKYLVLLAAAALPLLLWMALHHHEPLTWVPFTTAKSVALYFSALGGNAGWLLPAVELVVILSALGAAQHANVRLLAAWFVVPVAATISVSALQACFVPRFLLPGVVVLAVLLGAALDEHRRSWRIAVLSAAIGLGLIAGLWHYYTAAQIDHQFLFWSDLRMVGGN